MHIVVGLIFIMLGATCVGYLWAGGPLFDREPPLLALGILLIFLAAGLAGRSRSAALLARAGLGAALVAMAWSATRYVGFGTLDRPDELMRRVYLVGITLGAIGIVALFLLVRRVKPLKKFGVVDVLPLTGLAVALMAGVLWFVGDDARLRPCRVGNDAACEVIATRLLEASERAPAAPPTRAEEAAARTLDTPSCDGLEPAACALRRYAVGTVWLRAGRHAAAREAFLRACEEDRSWCARAAQEKTLVWTAEERARLVQR